MNELLKYEDVNKCETLEELSLVILSLANSKGLIEGRNKNFVASVMSDICKNYCVAQHNMLTREYGIRQQAIYILFYNNEIN